MKRTKKLASLLLALGLTLSLSMPAFASSDTSTGMEGNIDGGKITINDAMPGETYKAYQILYLESYKVTDETTGAGQYSYKANSEWLNWLKSDAAKDYVAVDDLNYVTWVGENNSTRAAEFAALLKGELSSKTPAKSTTAPAAAEGAEYSTVEFSDLKLGYYLVDTTTGSLCSLDTTNKEITMQEKNESPTIVKKVQEDSLENTESKGWQDANDADIGQVVQFKTTVTAKKGAKNYEVHDAMSAGLTLNADSIEITGSASESGLVKGTDYTVVTYPTADGTECTHGEGDAAKECDFVIKFSQDYLNTITTDTVIVITYSATLNEGAVIAGAGNPNDTMLKYGNESFTQWDETRTYTWKGDIFKYTLNGEAKTALANAKFTLSKNADGSTPINLIDITGDAEDAVPTYRVAKVGETGTVADNTIVTNENGKFEIVGLDADTYYLTETAAPEGYNKLAGPIKVVIDSSVDTTESTKMTNTITYQNHTGKTDKPYEGDGVNINTTENQIQVENKSGALFPATGGMGTTILYIAGGTMVAAAGILLITKKRMSK